MTQRSIGVGLVGTGFMGKTHALAWRGARATMGGDLPSVRLELLCDQPLARAEAMADQFGFAAATEDWRALMADPRIDVVSITTPNALHHEMALAALAAGKHVWCEKPMALTLEQVRAMEAAARASGRKTLVGYNYIRNPAFRHALKLIREGVIGRPVHFRGWVDEDYQADPDLPWTWRAKLSEAGLGTLGDLGCHLVSFMSELMGPAESLLAETQIIHETRPLPEGGGRGPVENEDVANALIRFESGAQGVFTTSRSAWGRKNRLGWEVHGLKGMLIFDQERMNELQLYVDEGPKAAQGFRTILTGPEHPPFGSFVPAPGHQLGFLDLKTIEAAELLRDLGGGAPARPDFSEALKIEIFIHAVALAAREGRRVRLSEFES
ncbi:Gfo/Idh/MocA family protein [Neomegalonema perideroedes]|uniref:Gfo/Idh/MocA family protein n=1 Tax=Neomegalonema perideroedes TaxID=217219 RepID=UPI00037D6B38|nr:Gfo/Idh/MocA family oxidoreductase [Neomegalonema perideroedes]